MKKIVGIGNALTDVLVNLRTEDVLTDFGLARGSMSLVDSSLQRKISASIADLPHTLSLGGSAANTIRAMARMSADVGFIGKVGDDGVGDFYHSALENLNIRPTIFRGTLHSGRCVSLISPDGERTMVTYLGSAMELRSDEISSAIFEDYNCLYIEGYLVQDHDLIRKAVSLAKSCGLKVAIDLASFNVVMENIDFLRDIVSKYVDILFANEQEAEAFSGESDPIKALEYISAMCELTVVKIGIQGAYIKSFGGEVIHVGIMAAAKRVDTTGAGDFYAAGFLTGLSMGLSLRQCGTIGAIAAGKVIEVVGTTFSDDIWNEVNLLIESVKNESYLF